MAQREIFSTRFATLMTMAGVAIGLGNVWRFPYMMGRYGGSAFLIVYLVFVVLFAVPALMAEWALGRQTRRGPVGAFTEAFGPLAGRIIGALLLATVLVADSYYLVVIANIVYAGGFSIVHGFGPEHLPAFEAGIGHGRLQYAIALGVLAMTLLVIHRGLRRGIEATSKVFVPFAGVIVLILVAYTLSLPGALVQLGRFLHPDFSALGAEQLFAALGQAFFSAGLGGTFMLVYGSYLRDNESIPGAAVLTALGDAGAALMAALFIVPAILVFGLDMSAGPSLIFATLPQLFGSMPGGQLVGSLFLIALAVMAFLSNVAAIEVFVDGIGELVPMRMQRGGIILVVLGVEAALMLPSALVPGTIGTLDLIFGSGMQVLGSALAVAALVWGLGQVTTLKQMFGARGATRASGENSGTARAARSVTAWQASLFWWLRWVVPGALFAILLGYIHSKIG